jgi:hypothetical protein
MAVAVFRSDLREIFGIISNVDSNRRFYVHEMALNVKWSGNDRWTESRNAIRFYIEFGTR